MLKTKKEILDIPDKTYHSIQIMPWMVSFSDIFYPNSYSDFQKYYLDNMIYCFIEDSYYKILCTDDEETDDTYIIYFKKLNNYKYKLIKYVSNEINMCQLCTIHFKLSKMDVTTCIATQSKQQIIDTIMIINTNSLHNWTVIDYEFRTNQQLSMITSYANNSIWNVNHILEDIVFVDENNKISNYEHYENNVSPIPIEQRTIGNKAPSLNEILFAY